LLGRHEQGRQRRLEALVVDHAHRPPRAEPRRRLHHDRVADLADEAPGLLRRAQQRLRGHRQARLAQHPLHLVLLAEVTRHRLAHPGDADPVAGHRQRQLHLLEEPDQAVDPAPVALERQRRRAQLLRVEAVRNLIVARDRRSIPLWQAIDRLVRDEPDPHVRRPISASRHCKMLVLKNGAT
jgi:hypothetical protein